MNKRAIAILGAIFLLIVLTLAFLIYQKNKSKTPDGTEITQDQDGSADTDQETTPIPPALNKAIKLTDDQVVSPVLFYQGDGVTYFTRSGQLFRNKITVTNGTVLLANKEELPIPLKGSLQKIIWPQASDNFIAEIGTSTNPSYSVYVNDKGGYTDLPSKVTSIDWLPSGAQYLFIWLENNKATLNIANADGSDYKILADMWEPDNKIHVSPDGKNVLYYRTGNTESTNNINMVSADGKTFKAIVKDGYNYGVLWSPDSKKFLFGKRDVATGSVGLYIGNIETGLVTKLDLMTTPEKAVWTQDGSSFVVAVPKQSGSSGGFSQDSFYKVSSINTTKESFEPGVAVDAEELFLSLDGDRVFFRSMQDGALYYLNLQ